MRHMKRLSAIIFTLLIMISVTNLLSMKTMALTDPYDCYWSYVFRNPKMAQKISQKYSANHYGIDIIHATPGEISNDYPIYNVGSGTVLYSGYSSTAGYYTVVAIADGYTTRSLHMKSSPYYAAGSAVTSSSILGIVGNTGDSYGAHLHFDVNTVGAISGGSGNSYVNYYTTVNPEEFFSTINFTY